MQFLHCPMLFSLAMIEKIERSGERNMAKVFFMRIRNIVPLMDPQFQPPPSREFLAMHTLHSSQLSSLAGAGGGEEAGAGTVVPLAEFPAGRPRHWEGLASSSG